MRGSISEIQCSGIADRLNQICSDHTILAESLDIDLGDYTYWVPEGTAYPRSKIIKDVEQRDRRHEGKFILLDGFDYKGRKCLQICDVFVTKIETYVVDITINMAEVHGNRTHLTRF